MMVLKLGGIVMMLKNYASEDTMIMVITLLANDGHGDNFASKKYIAVGLTASSLSGKYG